MTLAAADDERADPAAVLGQDRRPDVAGLEDEPRGVAAADGAASHRARALRRTRRSPPARPAARRSAAGVTVHAATSRPASARALERRGGDRAFHWTAIARQPSRVASSTASASSATALSQRGQSGSALAIAASDASSNEDTTARSGALPRPARSTSAVALACAGPLSSTSRKASGGSAAEHLGQRRDPRLAQLGRRQVGHGLVAALDALERLVVEEHRHAVAAEADVELHAVDAGRPGREHAAPRASSPAPGASRRGGRAGAAWPRRARRRRRLRGALVAGFAWPWRRASEPRLRGGLRGRLGGGFRAHPIRTVRRSPGGPTRTGSGPRPPAGRTRAAPRRPRPRRAARRSRGSPARRPCPSPRACRPLRPGHRGLAPVRLPRTRTGTRPRTSARRRARGGRR